MTHWSVISTVDVEKGHRKQFAHVQVHQTYFAYSNFISLLPPQSIALPAYLYVHTSLRHSTKMCCCLFADCTSSHPEKKLTKRIKKLTRALTVSTTGLIPRHRKHSDGHNLRGISCATSHSHLWTVRSQFLVAGEADSSRSKVCQKAF